MPTGAARKTRGATQGGQMRLAVLVLFLAVGIGCGARNAADPDYGATSQPATASRETSSEGLAARETKIVLRALERIYARPGSTRRRRRLRWGAPANF
jgi:hypothetical protein